MVCGVGPRVSHGAIARDRPGFRQAAARCCFLREWYMHPNGQSRPTSGRSGRESAGACLGGWRVYKIAGSARPARPRASSSASSTSCCSISPGGSTARTPRAQLFSGRLPRASTTSACSIARKPLPTGGHLEQADGTAWMAFYCLTMLAMALELAERGSGVRGHRLEVLRALHLIADAMNHLGRHGAVGRAGWLLLRPVPCRRIASTAANPLDGRPDSRCSRSRCSRSPRLKSSGIRKRMKWFLNTARTSRSTSRMRALGRQMGALLAIPNRERLARVLRRVLDETEFLSPMGFVRCPRSTARTRSFEIGGQTYPRGVRARRFPSGCSAATPTGVVRSGSRSIIC